MNKTKCDRGFIALTLIITVATMLFVFSLIQLFEIGHFFDQAQLKRYRLMNYYNAYNCIDQVVLNLTHDYFYRVSTSTRISNLKCSIDSVKEEDGYLYIRVQGNFKNINVKRLAIAKLYDNRVEVISID